MKKIINAKNAPSAVGPYCHAVQVGDMIFTSGQIGLNPADDSLVEGVEAQATQALSNIKVVLEEAGFTMDDVVKTTVFLDNIADFGAINEIYATAFGDNKPARSCVEAGALPKGALFEIEVIAAK